MIGCHIQTVGKGKFLCLAESPVSYVLHIIIDSYQATERVHDQACVHLYLIYTIRPWAFKKNAKFIWPRSWHRNWICIILRPGAGALSFQSTVWSFQSLLPKQSHRNKTLGLINKPQFLSQIYVPAILLAGYNGFLITHQCLWEFS